MNGTQPHDIRPLKAAADIEVGLNMPLIILIVVLIILAAAIFIFIKKRKKTVERPQEPSEPPGNTAARELEELLAMNLIEEGRVKEYYIRISDIIRKFIESKLTIEALDKTTWELYQEMRSKKTDRKLADNIRDFLEECDRVKFAKYIPTKKETEKLTGRAKDIIVV